jgi:hypothetical protein
MGAMTLLHEAYLSLNGRENIAFPDRQRFLIEHPPADRRSDQAGFRHRQAARGRRGCCTSHEDPHSTAVGPWHLNMLSRARPRMGSRRSTPTISASSALLCISASKPSTSFKDLCQSRLEMPNTRDSPACELFALGIGGKILRDLARTDQGGQLSVKSC